MTTEMRKTGIDVVGDMPWGTHVCLFYETKEDLLDTLVSYCKAGLESQEFCLWVVAEPVREEEARHALKQVVPDLDRYLADHSIDIVSAGDWYLQGGSFDLKRVMSGWHERLALALARGYAGVRVTGDTAWLEKKDWKGFCEYEETLNESIANQRLPCCARTRSPHAELRKSWMWRVHTSLPSQSDTRVGKLSKPPGSSKPRPKSRA